MTKNEEKDIKIEQEIDKAWRKLWEFANGEISLHDCSIDCKDFIESGKKLFDVKIKSTSQIFAFLNEMPAMKYSFIGTILFFKLDSPSNYNYAPVIISNEDVIVLKRILNEDFGVSFGSYGILQFQRREPFLYWEPQDNANNLEEASARFNEYMEIIKLKFYVFDSFLWFIKDNSVNIPSIYAVTRLGRVIGQLAYEQKILTTNCTGKFKTCSFTPEDINRSLQIRRTFLEICPSHKNEDHWGYDREVNRIEKAFRFLCTARTDAYLPAKIAGYMSCFESLFSTEAG